MSIRTRSPISYKAKFRDTETESGEPMTIITSLLTNKDTDGHNTHLSEDSIDNISKAEDVTLLDSHNHRTTGYGTSIRIWREDDNVFGDFGILHKSKWSSLMTYQDAESLLYDLRHRPFDTSIGFSNDMDVCDLCIAIDGEARDIWFDDACEHWLGDSYENPSDAGERVKATAEIRGANIHEDSLVFAGSNDKSHILSEAQRQQSIVKAEQLLKEGRLPKESVVRMARELQLPELRAVVGPKRRDKIFIPNKRSKTSMAVKSVEALTARVEELEEELESATETKDEIKGLYDRERKRNKALKQENKTLKSQVSTLEDLEDDLRDTCRDLVKAIEDAQFDEDKRSEAELTELETEIESATYKQLQRKLNSLGRERKRVEKERDIVIEINKVETGEDDDITLPEADDDKKPVQPFMQRGELDERFFHKD